MIGNLHPRLSSTHVARVSRNPLLETRSTHANTVRDGTTERLGYPWWNSLYPSAGGLSPHILVFLKRAVIVPLLTIFICCNYEA